MPADTGGTHVTPPQPRNWTNYCQIVRWQCWWWWWGGSCRLPSSSPWPAGFSSDQRDSCTACFGTRCGSFCREPWEAQNTIQNAQAMTNAIIVSQDALSLVLSLCLVHTSKQVNQFCRRKSKRSSSQTTFHRFTYHQYLAELLSFCPFWVRISVEPILKNKNLTIKLRFRGS